MKKILLATSALATAGVLASPVLAQQESQEGSAMMAMSDETSITIYQEFGYSHATDNPGNVVYDDGDNYDEAMSSLTADNADREGDKRDGMWTDGEVRFSFASTSDTGLRYSVHAELETTPNQGDAVDEASLSIGTAGFGTVTLGANDDVSADFATYSPGNRNMAIADGGVTGAIDAEGNDIDAGLDVEASGAAYGDSSKIAYRSPVFSGFSFGASYALRNDSVGGATNEPETGEKADTAVGFKYSTEFGDAAFDFTFANRSNGETGSASASNTHLGLKVGIDRLTLTVGQDSVESGDSTSGREVGTTAFGIGYSISDNITVAAGLANSEITKGQGTQEANKGATLDTTSFGFDYTIAPGLNLAVAMNQYSFDSNDDNRDLDSDEIRTSLQINF